MKPNGWMDGWIWMEMGGGMVPMRCVCRLGCED